MKSKRHRIHQRHSKTILEYTMKGKSLIFVGALLSQACVVVESDKYDSSYDSSTYDINSNPIIESAEAGCFYDSLLNEDLWYFDASVYDPDSDYDVVAVYVDVYDSWTGELEDTFTLEEDDTWGIWTAEWFESSTNLDCFYDGYEIDVSAYDAYDGIDMITIIPSTY